MSNAWDAMVSGTQTPFDPRANKCWLTGLTDPNNYGYIAGAHIVDKVLCETDEEMYDPSNQVRLHSTVHQMWDARMFSIDPMTGGLITSMPAQMLKKVGLTPASRLPKEALTPRRVAYLKSRCNGWCEFQMVSSMRKAKKRRHEETTDPVAR